MLKEFVKQIKEVCTELSKEPCFRIWLGEIYLSQKFIFDYQLLYFTCVIAF